MKWRNVIAILGMLLGTGAAFADTFAGEVAQGNTLLKNGDTKAALDIYRDLQIDDPESDLLYFNIGCAQYEDAMASVSDNDTESAAQLFKSARQTFEKAAGSDAPDIRQSAKYNLANCTAQTAKQAAASGNHEEAVQAFKDAIQEYESFLEQHPGHEGATTNLDHMRFLLKKMLQNPPPPEQQDQGSDKNEKEKQENDKHDTEEKANA